MTNSHVVVGGGAHKVMGLHQWFGSARGWGPLVDALDRDAFTYAFMDYRGYGDSKDLRGRYTVDEIAADALALADELRWDRFSLLGHSMGGMAIQRVFVEAPQRVDKLVAITPVPASGVPFDEQGWALFSSAAQSLDARKSIINMATGSRLSDYWVGQMAKRSMQTSTPEACAAYLIAWAKTDFSERVKGNPVLIKVIIGEHDPVLNVDVMTNTYLQWFPNAVLEVMPNASHCPMDETPVALATSIENFLRE